jgi:hypothetical protein
MNGVLRRFQKTVNICLRYPAVLLVLVSGLLVSPVVADEPELTYDIYSRDGQLTIWVDLSPFIDGPTVSRLKDGIDVLIECQVSLQIPRRFFGDKQVTRKSQTTRLSYRGVTEEFRMTHGFESKDSVITFVSLALLFQYFRDSVEIGLCPLDSLDNQERYVLGLDITTISLTDFNLAPEGDSSDEAESPLRYLFRQFLNLTDYGRNDYSTKSRPFSIDEISPEF